MLWLFATATMLPMLRSKKTGELVWSISAASTSLKIPLG